jgi:hypothetical protein
VDAADTRRASVEIFAAQDALDRAGFALRSTEGMTAGARADLIADLQALSSKTAGLIAHLTATPA